MRYLGLDFGSKTVGVAVSDPLNITAQALEIIRRQREDKLRQTLARIEEIILEYSITDIVLGYPLNMDETEGERAKLSLEFKDKLERRTGLPVHMWDERLTTVEADEIMSEVGIKQKDRKAYVDMIAAQVILEGYMNYGKDNICRQ
ncbi:MAG: Holliday junction resolvase RuvX [Lachnospiraceae bacterium]|nr:Holliday junction resolvase RuvX [Lachnospiraceae bacterium]